MVRGAYLGSLFRATERANYDGILALAERRAGGSLLDCGCGDGEFTARVARACEAREVWGIESVEPRIAEAESRGIRVVSHDLNRILPFPDGRFDVVHANQLLEHLHNTDGFLRELLRVLKPDGYLLLSTNNLSSWHNILSLVLGMQPPPMHVSSEAVLGNRLDPFRGHRFGSREDSHLRVFSYVGLRDLLRFHGFRVQHLRSIGCYPFPPAVARWVTALDRRHGVFLVAKAVRSPAPVVED